METIICTLDPSSGQMVKKNSDDVRLTPKIVRATPDKKKNLKYCDKINNPSKCQYELKHQDNMKNN